MNLQTLARQLLPFLKPLLTVSSSSSTVSGAPSPHGLDSVHHSGTLANSQAPQFLLLDGSRALTGNLSVGTGITIDGVDLSAHAADASAHHDPVTVATPSGLSLAGQQLALADTVAGDGLTISGKVLAVGAGNGLTVNANDVALTTPGTLSVSSSNNAASNHTHAVTSASNPGAAASLLASDASGHLQLTRLGAGVTPSVPLHALGTSEQLRLAYDGSNYAAFTVGSGGNLTLAPTGDLVFDPTGNDILPNTGYDLNLGSLQKKYLTLHAAELWVETLVAQNTIATIGGRLLIGPTTTLIEDVNPLALAIKVKHNQMAAGDIGYLEANGQVEFMQIAAGPTPVTGGYQYSVTRNLDGSGANNWYAGDAVFNTGTTGDGHIDLYSLSGVLSGAGPTIVGNVRNSSTYNDWTEHWAIGNLNGVYGYGTDTYGAGLGKYADNWLTIEPTNGIRMYGAGLKKVDIQADGDVFIGTNSSAPGTTYFSLFSNAQTYNGESMGAGDMLIGDNSASKANLLWDESEGRLKFRGGTLNGVIIDTDGSMYLIQGTNNVNKLRWEDGSGNETGEILGVEAGSSATIQHWVVGGSSSNSHTFLIGANDYANLHLTDSTLSGFSMRWTIDDHAGAGGPVLFRRLASIGPSVYENLFTFTTSGTLLVKDSANANMTTGLTINQGAADDEILAFKSSDVATGATSLSETDTYAWFKKANGAYGGLRMAALAESTPSTVLELSANGGTAGTGKGSTSQGLINLKASQISGTGEADVTANGNLVSVQGYVSGAYRTALLVDVDGDIHMDATSNINAWDAHDDIQLLAGVREAMNPGLRFGEFVEGARAVLERTGVVTYNPDGHHFVSLKNLHALEIDAMRQLYQRIEKLEKELEALR